MFEKSRSGLCMGMHSPSPREEISLEVAVNFSAYTATPLMIHYLTLKAQEYPELTRNRIFLGLNASGGHPTRDEVIDNECAAAMRRVAAITATSHDTEATAPLTKYYLQPRSRMPSMLVFS